MSFFKNTAIIICLLVMVLLQACDKKPGADFSANKAEYISGETVILNNTCKNAYTYEWITPAGQINTKAADKQYYDIADDFGFGSLEFSLTVYSKHHKKNASKSTTVQVIPQSIISLGGLVIYCNHISKHYDQIYDHIGFTVYNDNNVETPVCNEEAFTINFKGNQLPLAGTYTLVSNSLNIQNNEAYIYIAKGHCEMPYTAYSTGGQLFVDMVNGRLHIVFNNVDTNDSAVKLSGEVFVPSTL